MAARYISYYLASKTLNSITAPNIIELINETLEDTREYYAFRELEVMRTDMLRRQDKIEILDLGAGSKVSNTKHKTVAQIAKSALSPSNKAQFLFRLVKYLQPSSILELGTSLGLSALYMHKGCSSSRLITIEGSPHIAHVAKHYFDIEKVDIDLIVSSFDDALSSTQLKNEKQDLIYVDGNHTKEATMRYVDLLYDNLTDGGIFILDDIYWSAGMTAAWKSLKEDRRFRFALDLFDYGILIKSGNKDEHESLTIIQKKKKPFA